MSKATIAKYESVSDEKLMVLLSSGDKAAFNELYRRYAKKMFYYFYKMLNRDTDKAEDFAQDLFMKIIDRPEMFDSSRKFSTWIYVIASNMCKNEYRRLNVRKTEDETEIEVMPAPNLSITDGIDNSDFVDKLHSELEELNPKHKEVFLMRFQQGLQLKEIADVLNISEGTVKSRLFYCVRNLAGKLEEYNPKK